MQSWPWPKKTQMSDGQGKKLNIKILQHSHNSENHLPGKVSNKKIRNPQATIEPYSDFCEASLFHQDIWNVH